MHEEVLEAMHEDDIVEIDDRLFTSLADCYTLVHLEKYDKRKDKDNTVILSFKTSSIHCNFAVLETRVKKFMPAGQESE